MQLNWSTLFALLSLYDMTQDQGATRVAVYRGPATGPELPESAADLIKSTFKGAKITYVGPKEDVDISLETLKHYDVYVQPGGGSLAPAWKHMKRYAKPIREYVSGGGRYMGFCLGAYLAGQDPGFSILQQDGDTGDEFEQKGAQVKNQDDTVIQVDWNFSYGPNAGKTVDNRWLYFQDGAYIDGLNSSAKVLGRYSKTGNVAAAVMKYYEGVVGVVGPHPEATKDWYEEYDIHNPDGYNLDIGRDFVREVLEWNGNQ